MSIGISPEQVREYFDATVARDAVRLSHILDDQVVWTLAGPVDLIPFCGQRRGKQEVIDTITRLTPSLIRLTGMEIEELLLDGDRAAAFIRVSATHCVTGRTISYRNAHFMRFRDGKLVELRAVIDSFDAAEQVLGHPIKAPLSMLRDFPPSGNRIAI